MGPKLLTWNFYFMSDFDRVFFIKFIMTFPACVFQTTIAWKINCPNTKREKKPFWHFWPVVSLQGVM
jgi:hypothetical protein